jgi:hypothetical protein
VSGNRTAYGVMAVLAVVLGVIGIIGKSTKKEPPNSFMDGGAFRAVVVPTDMPRTVVVTPCDAPSPTTGNGAMETPGVTTVRLQRDSGLRTVLVPRCSALKGTQQNGMVNVPSAAFVLKPGERADTRAKAAKTGVQAQIVVPSQSRAETIVVPPCRAQGTPDASPPRDVVLRPGALPGTAVAPAC